MFLFKLAGHLGKTVAELSETLSITEFNEWLAYDRVDPIGGYRGDLQAAVIARSMAGGDLKDHIVIDPSPMTDEQKEQAEEARRKARRTANLARILNAVSHNGKPLKRD